MVWITHPFKRLVLAPRVLDLHSRLLSGGAHNHNNKLMNRTPRAQVMQQYSNAPPTHTENKWSPQAERRTSLSNTPPSVAHLNNVSAEKFTSLTFSHRVCALTLRDYILAADITIPRLLQQRKKRHCWLSDARRAQTLPKEPVNAEDSSMKS